MQAAVGMPRPLGDLGLARWVGVGPDTRAVSWGSVRRVVNLER